jgi:glutathione S-transferase
MIVVHHLGRSQSERIVWLFEELGLPYEPKVYDREQSGMAPPAYKALHPLGAAPIITDGDLTLAESGAIIEYVIGKYANGRLSVKPDQPNYADYLYWFHFVNGTMLPGAMVGIYARMLGVGPDHPMSAMIAQRADRCFVLVENRLAVAPYLAGPDFTAADIMMGYGLTTMRNNMPRDLTPYPNIRAYLKRIGERPAYQRAMEKGDPGMPLNLS